MVDIIKALWVITRIMAMGWRTENESGNQKDLKVITLTRHTPLVFRGRDRGEGELIIIVICSTSY